ncbi:hypothetical protein [Leptospira noguchii]|uniref:Uncharacterized protein n=1 Tax=Leptospira noguchii TaxID=28182 RepID=A0AAE9GB70_9LEPT|nr:hypothetical protein [Leptospira noguchii]UOG56886.1 hypothetical protein MAL03_01275 [Leptospira noguchii]
MKLNVSLPELSKTLFTKAFETQRLASMGALETQRLASMGALETQRLASMGALETQRLASPMYLVSSPSAILLHKTILS